MKLVNKLQEGGIAPFMVYTPNPANSGAATAPAASSSSSGKDAGMSKDIIKMIYENGVPADVDSFLTQLSGFTTGLTGETGGLDQLMQSPQGYSMLISNLNKLKFNKEELTKARDQLYSNGGLQEAAISTNGTVIGRNSEGQLKSMSIDEYSKNKDNYQLLTNNDLLQMRSYDKNGAFNNSMISILQNGEGMENVQKTIKGVVDQMKVQKQKGEQFLDASQSNILKGIDGLQGLLKVGESQESSRVYAQQALEYLYTTLPQSQRNLLRAKAAQMGLDPTKGALDIIKQNIIFGTQESKEQTLDLKEMPGGSGSGEGGGGTSEIRWLHDWVGNSINKNGKGLQPMDINIGTNMSIFAPSQTIGSIVDAKTGETLNRNSTIGSIIEKGFSTIGDGSNVYWGDEKVTADKLDNLVSTGKPVTKAYLPIDLDAYNKTGEIKPDLEVSKRMSEAEKEIKAKRVTNPLEKLRIYSSHQVADYVSKDGKGIDISNTQLIQPFALIQAMGQGKQVVSDINSTYLNEIDKSADVERILNNAKFGAGTKKDYLNNWFGTSVYEGTVFIHTTDNMSAAATAGGNLNLPKSRFNAEQVERTNMETDRQLNYRNRNFSTNSLQDE